jgi:hypothetical protein
MTDVINDYNLCFSIHLINNPVISDSNSIKPFSASKFTILGWKGISGERFNSFDYSGNMLFTDVPQVSFCRTLPLDFKGAHLFSIFP